MTSKKKKKKIQKKELLNVKEKSHSNMNAHYTCLSETCNILTFILATQSQVFSIYSYIELYRISCEVKCKFYNKRTPFPIMWYNLLQEIFFYGFK